MGNPTAAMMVIGDEILSGRTRDSNMYHLAGELGRAGLDLQEVRVIADERSAIIEAAQSLSAKFDHLFTSGGIGPTHDDITADCIAEALGVSIDIRDDARAILEAHYDRKKTTLNEARLRMARIPDGANLIDNPISAAPGFTLGNVHVMAGVPSVFQAMVASLLPTLAGGQPLNSSSLRIERAEGDIAGPLSEIADRYSDLSFGSYPFQQNGIYGANIVVRGNDPEVVKAAISALQDTFPDAKQ